MFLFVFLKLFKNKPILQEKEILVLFHQKIPQTVGDFLMIFLYVFI